MSSECKAQLDNLSQGNRHTNPIITVVDGDGDPIADTDTATWTGQVRRAGGTWRDIEGTLTGLADGRVQWAVADADDEADTPLNGPVPYELMLKGEFSGQPLYTVTGEFLLCRGGW